MIKKILSKFLLIILYVVLFISLSYATFVLYPYIASNKYENRSEVDSFFPIAIMTDDGPDIVRWIEYKDNIQKYSEIILTPTTTEETYELKTHNTSFIPTIVLAKENQKIKLNFYDDDYFYYSEYFLSNEGVIPLYFRYTGAFVAIYAILISIVGTPVIYALAKYFVINRLSNLGRKSIVN